MTNLIKIIFSFFLLTGQGWCVDPSFFDESSHIESISAYSVIVKNVGQGSCTIVKNHDNGHHLIVDAGSSSGAPPGLNGRISEEFGFSEAASDIPFVDGSITVVVSHSDQDHIDLFKTVFGLNQPLLNRVGRIVLGDHFDNYFRLGEKNKETGEQKPVQETREFIRDFVLRIPGYPVKLLSLSHDGVEGLDLNSLLKKDIVEVTSVTVPYKGFLPPELIVDNIEILGANAGAGSDQEKNTNSNSAVVRLSIGDTNILIMGDATGHTTGRILTSGMDPSFLKADLLIASHHGADNEDANHITWAVVTEPRQVVMSHGFNAGYGHPTLTAVANFLVCGVKEKIEDHVLAISNGPAIDSLIMPFFRMKIMGEIKKDKRTWKLFSTDRPIYGTAMSGDLAYVYAKDGSLISFAREH